MIYMRQINRELLHAQWLHVLMLLYKDFGSRLDSGQLTEPYGM